MSKRDIFLFVLLLLVLTSCQAVNLLFNNELRWEQRLRVFLCAAMILWLLVVCAAIGFRFVYSRHGEKGVAYSLAGTIIVLCGIGIIIAWKATAGISDAVGQSILWTVVGISVCAGFSMRAGGQAP